MADIYLSHSKWDRARIAPIVALLEREGWSVWQDTRIGAGEAWDDAWDETAAGEAGAAACIVVAWSVSSIDSDWVRAEARAGLERGILVPVLIEQATPPHLFSAIPTADLTGWKGDAAAPEARAFVESVRRTAGVPGLWAAAKSARGAPEIEDWESVKASRDHADFENFLSLHPKGPLADPARTRLEQLQLYDEALTRPAPTSGAGRLWLLAAALVAIAGAGTWYSLDPRFAPPALEVQSGSDVPPPPVGAEPDAPPVTAEPEAPPEPTAAPQADVAPSAAEPPAENPDVYKPFGDKTKGCPAEELACRSTPGCVWWAAFNICVVQEPGADGQLPQEQTAAPPSSTVPQCPADEATCRVTADCQWVDYFNSCLPKLPPATTEAPAEAPLGVPECSSIGDQATCSDAACEWIVDQCFEKPIAPE